MRLTAISLLSSYSGRIRTVRYAHNKHLKLAPINGGKYAPKLRGFAPSAATPCFPTFATWQGGRRSGVALSSAPHHQAYLSGAWSRVRLRPRTHPFGARLRLRSAAASVRALDQTTTELCKQTPPFVGINRCICKV